MSPEPTVIYWPTLRRYFGKKRGRGTGLYLDKRMVFEKKCSCQMSRPCELDSSLIILSRHRKSGFEQEAWGPPPSAARHRLSFYGCGLTSGVRGFSGPGCPVGRRSRARVLRARQPGRCCFRGRRRPQSCLNPPRSSRSRLF